MRISSQRRWLLVALIAAGQALVLFIASLWLVNWLRSAVSESISQQLNSAAIRYANQWAATLEASLPADAGADDLDWARVQEAMEKNQVPDAPVLCIVGPDGRVLGHRAGAMEKTPDDVEADILAAIALPKVNATLYVLRPLRAISQAVHEFSSTVRGVALTLSLAVVAFSTLLTSSIIRRYENRLASINENLEELVQVRSQALLKSRGAVIFGLAKLAESRDDQTGEHLERIRHYVLILARELSRTVPELDDAMIETLAETSALHDIGKVGIPDSILLSPDPLSEQQRTIMRKHPVIGGDTLLELKRRWGDDPFLVTACEIAFAHHERWDGTGYPFGLAGDDIPLAARIVAVADVYDALTSKRSYKDSHSHEEARRVIVEGSGTHFDPQVVDAFLRQEAEFEAALRRR